MASNPETELLERIDALIARGVVSIRDVIAAARRPERRLHELELVRVRERDEDEERDE